MNVCPDTDFASAATSPTRMNRRIGIAAFAVLTGLLSSGSTAPTACQSSGGNIGPSEGEVIAAGVGVVAVIATVTIVAVNHSHHTLKGCVYSGPSGVRLKTSDSKIYSIEGDAASIKVGDKVKFHGLRVKKTKDADGDQVFKVENVSKDYGPCKIDMAQSQSAIAGR